MPEQSVKLGEETGFSDLKCTRTWNIENQPRTAWLRGRQWRLTASLAKKVGGTFSANCSVHEDHVVTVTHNIDSDSADLTVQRFVKAVGVMGKGFKTTPGTGYLHWSELQDGAPEQRHELHPFCESKFIGIKNLQFDGPKGAEKLKKFDGVRFEIHDAPGLLMTQPRHFPLAYLTGFIVRITVSPKDGWPAEIVEFPYRSYFEIYSDPYSEAFRKSSSVPHGTPSDATLSFNEIAERYDLKCRALDAAPAAANSKATGSSSSSGAGGRRRSF